MPIQKDNTKLNIREQNVAALRHALMERNDAVEVALQSYLDYLNRPEDDDFILEYWDVHALRREQEACNEAYDGLFFHTMSPEEAAFILIFNLPHNMVDVQKKKGYLAIAAALTEKTTTTSAH